MSNDLLWSIQRKAPNTKAQLYPDKDQIFEVDLNTRTISVPEFLSVSKDHVAETVYFKIDRFYENVDLATKVGIIQYKNASGEEYVYPIPYYDLLTYATWNDELKTNNGSKMLLPWCIQGPATAAAGEIQFAIRFFQLNTNKEIIYDLNTLPAKSKILEGQDWELNDIDVNKLILDDSFLLNLQRIEEAQDKLNLYWLDV